jgi:hypothetical protein
MKNTGFRFWGALCMVLAVCIGLTTVLSYVFARHTLTGVATTNFERMANKRYELLTTWLKNGADLIEATNENVALYDLFKKLQAAEPNSSNALDQFFRAQLIDSHIEVFFLLSPDHTILYSSSGREDRVIGQKQDLSQGARYKNHRAHVLSLPPESPLSGSPTSRSILLSLPILSLSGRLHGYLAARLDKEKTFRRLEEGIAALKSSRVYLLERTKDNKLVPITERLNERELKLITTALGSRNERMFNYFDDAGHRHLALVKSIPGLPWVFLLTADAAELYESMVWLRSEIYLAGLATFLLGCLALLIISRRMTW